MEVTSKRRNWIKNAVIIFLVILLILTFFSNTIMNRSLPEVATQYVMSETITTAVRGTGTVSANSDYEVEYAGDRTIKTVVVKAGSTVAAGDVLFELYEEEEDGTVEQLREELSELEYNYRLALLNMTDSDYARENRDIADAKEELQELVSQRDASLVTSGDMLVAENNVTAAEKAVEDAQEKVDTLTEQISEIGGSGSGTTTDISSLIKKLNEAEKELQSARITYAAEYTIMDAAFKIWKSTLDTASQNKSDSILYPAFIELLGKTDDVLENQAKKAITTVLTSEDLVSLATTQYKNEVTSEVTSKYTEMYTEEIENSADVKTYRSNLESSKIAGLEEEVRTMFEKQGKSYTQEDIDIEVSKKYEKEGVGAEIDSLVDEYVSKKVEAKLKENSTAIQNEIDSTYNANVNREVSQRVKSLSSEGDYSAYCTAYSVVSAAEAEYNELYEQLYEASYSSIDSANATAQSDKLNTELKSAKEELKTATKALETAQKILTELETKQTNYETLSESVKTSERALEDLIFNLSEQKKTDNNAIAKDQLSLSRQKEEIDKKQAEIDKLTGGEAVNVITSPVDGTVTQINISAGKKTSTVTGALCVIEEAGRGYTLSIPITAEQSRKLTIGDTGTVDTGWWWGSTITATLTAMTPDPSNPQNQKIAYFSLEGDDINAGDQLTVSINQRSVAYDLVVPTSAVREDSNGKYVLLLQAKNTPLGDRYYAVRADIQVLASDDTNSAISGGVVSYDYVITSSSEPIEPGDMVRLSDK